MLVYTVIETSEGFTHIAPVFRVADISRTLAFYRDQLGFAVQFIYGGFYAGVCRDGCHIHLKCSTQAAFEREEHIDVSIGTHNAETLAASFAAADVTFVVPLRHMPYGTEFYVCDPDGVFWALSSQCHPPRDANV